jgi:Leu/Phe-tRNA-protein transferase
MMLGRSDGLRYSRSGNVILLPGDDPDSMVDAIVESDYPEEFCVSPYFDTDFTRALMRAGFLVMSMAGETPGEAFLLPKLHRERAVLMFAHLKRRRSVLRAAALYELRADTDFSTIMERCAEKHGDDWLTPTLRRHFAALRDPQDGSDPQFRSFGLYRNGVLNAGEFGVSQGGAYTSYSGYYDESSAGTIQMVLTGNLLEAQGYSFWDLGMPIPYKLDLGARVISRERFISLFRSTREQRIRLPGLPPST